MSVHLLISIGVASGLFLSGCSSIASNTVSKPAVEGLRTSNSSTERSELLTDVPITRARAKAHEDEALGLRLLQLGRIPEAESALKSALAQDQSLVAAREGMGLVFMKQDNFALAETMLQSALQSDSSRASTWNILGVLYDLQERFTESNKAYENAIALNPQMPKYFNNLGYSYYLQGRDDEAETQYRRALDADSAFDQAWANLALVYARRDNQDEAKLAFQNILDEHKALNNLAYVNILLDNRQVAKEQLNSSIQKSPNYGKAFENLKSLDGSSNNPDDVELARTLRTKPRGASTVLAVNESVREPASERLLPSRGASTLLLSTTPLSSVVSEELDTPSSAASDAALIAPGITEKPGDEQSLDVNIKPMTPELIESIQSRLAELGYDTGPVNGEMGAKTYRSIFQFKIAEKLVVDNSITQRLLNALDI